MSGRTLGKAMFRRSLFPLMFLGFTFGGFSSAGLAKIDRLLNRSPHDAGRVESSPSLSPQALAFADGFANAFNGSQWDRRMLNGTTVWPEDHLPFSSSHKSSRINI